MHLHCSTAIWFSLIQGVHAAVIRPIIFGNFVAAHRYCGLVFENIGIIEVKAEARVEL